MYLCVEQPETMTAYFSTRRKPGVVFRVAATSPFQFEDVFLAWNCFPKLAIPLARVKIFNANLSPCKSLLTGPVNSATFVAGSKVSPSWKCQIASQFNFLKISSTKGFPQSVPKMMRISQI